MLKNIKISFSKVRSYKANNKSSTLTPSKNKKSETIKTTSSISSTKQGSIKYQICISMSHPARKTTIQISNISSIDRWLMKSSPSMIKKDKSPRIIKRNKLTNFGNCTISPNLSQNNLTSKRKNLLKSKTHKVKNNWNKNYNQNCWNKITQVQFPTRILKMKKMLFGTGSIKPTTNKLSSSWAPKMSFDKMNKSIIFMAEGPINFC